MSKFFAKNEETSSSEEESDKEEEKQAAAAQAAAKASKKKFYGGDSDDMEDEEQRTVKKGTDKRTEALTIVFDKMKNHIKISDFTALQADFEDIQTEINKCIAGGAFATDKLQTLPSSVIKNFILLDDCVAEVTSEEKKKMNKTNAAAFTKLKQKLKKYFAETGDHENFYVAQIEKYRKDPPKDESEAEEDEEEGESDEESGSDDSDESGSSSSEEKEVKPKAKKAEKKKDSSSSGSGSSSSSSSSSSDENESGSESDGSSKSKKSGLSSGEESEEEVLKAGELPKKYAFLALSREQMTPQQKRWKWVSFDQLPEDMKKYIRPPSKVRVSKQA